MEQLWNNCRFSEVSIAMATKIYRLNMVELCPFLCKATYRDFVEMSCHVMSPAVIFRVFIRMPSRKVEQVGSTELVLHGESTNPPGPRTPPTEIKV